MAKEKDDVFEKVEVKKPVQTISYEDAIAVVEAKNKQDAEAVAKKSAEANKPRRFIPGKYVCTQTCYHNSVLYHSGDFEVFNNDKKAPINKEGFVAHFVLIEG